MPPRSKRRSKPNEVPYEAPQKQNPWPTLSSYQSGTGAFRPRRISWSAWSVFGMNPYTAGIAARHCAGGLNWIGMLAGGMTDPQQKLIPPPALRDAFAEAYKVVAHDKGRWLSWSVGAVGGTVHEWIEYAFDFRSPKKLYELSELDWWENWLKERVPKFQEIHDMLTAAGVPETTLRTITLESSSAEWEEASGPLREKIALGLAP